LHIHREADKPGCADYLPQIAPQEAAVMPDAAWLICISVAAGPSGPMHFEGGEAGWVNKLFLSPRGGGRR